MGSSTRIFLVNTEKLRNKMDETNLSPYKIEANFNDFEDKKICAHTIRNTLNDGRASEKTVIKLAKIFECSEYDLVNGIERNGKIIASFRSKN